jgi:ABC-type Na+ transport system ATPase subunit NatA
MLGADKEVRLELRPSLSVYLGLVGVLAIVYLYWFWWVEPTLAPVLVSMGVMAGVLLLQRPLTVRRVVLVGPDRVTIATRLGVTVTRHIPLAEVSDLREKPAGTKAKPGWALEVVMKDRSTRNFGRLNSGFRPQLRAARALLHRPGR